MDEGDLRRAAARWVGFRDLYDQMLTEELAYEDYTDDPNFMERLETCNNEFWNAQENLYIILKAWLEEDD